MPKPYRRVESIQDADAPCWHCILDAAPARNVWFTTDPTNTQRIRGHRSLYKASASSTDWVRTVSSTAGPKPQQIYSPVLFSHLKRYFACEYASGILPSWRSRRLTSAGPEYIWLSLAVWILAHVPLQGINAKLFSTFDPNWKNR